MLREPLSLTLRFYFKNNRRRDIDNHNELVLDALTGVVYLNDSQIRSLHTFFAVDPKRPRIEITVELAIGREKARATNRGSSTLGPSYRAALGRSKSGDDYANRTK